MYALYKNDKDNFIQNEDAINLAVNEYKPNQGKLNEKKYFHLLESIIYQLYNKNFILNINYLNYLQILLFGKLEQNGISLIYKLHNSKLTNILSYIDRIFGSELFYEKGHGISISNTQIHKLIKKLLK